MASLKGQESSSLRIVQVTDPHLGSETGFTLAGINTQQSFAAVLAEMLADGRQPDLLAVTGDIAADAEPEAYTLFSSMMSDTRLPYAWLPGNHDSFELMQEQLKKHPYRQLIEMGGWQLLFLDSAVPGQVGGSLGKDQLVFLEQLLAKEGSSPVAIFIHHPPLSVGCQWLDRQQLDNSDELTSLLSQSNRVKAIFTGHVHQQGEHDWAGTKVYTAPSTCVQFARGSDEFALSEKAPGYRWIELYPDGRIETSVHYLKNSQQRLDQQCMGY